MRLPAAFEEFCQFLRVEKEAAPRTLMTYLSRFDAFLQFVRTENSALMVSQFTVNLCRSYHYALDKRELGAATIRGRLAMLSSLGEWLVLRNRLPRNPIDQLTRPRLKDHPPRVPRRGLSWGNRPRSGADQPRRPHPRRAMPCADVYVRMPADGVAPGSSGR